MPPTIHMLLVQPHHAAGPQELVLTISAICGTYHVCVSYLDTIRELKAFLFPNLNLPYRAYPDEQTYYSSTYQCVLTDDIDLGTLVQDPILLLGLSDPVPVRDRIPQRSLIILPIGTDATDSSIYERILSIHRRLNIQFLPFLADWIHHDRLLSRVILDADHPQINWIVRKITEAIAVYPPCLRQIIFSVTDGSLLEWETLHTFYKRTTVPIFLEANVMRNRHELIYTGQSEQELEQGLLSRRPAKQRGLIPLQPALLMKENPTEREMATQDHIMRYDDPNLGESSPTAALRIH